MSETRASDDRWYPERGQCSGCTYWFRLRETDGTIRRHRDDGLSGTWWCPGSLLPPTRVERHRGTPLSERKRLAAPPTPTRGKYAP